MRERPLSDVPKLALAALVMAFGLQLGWHLTRPPSQVVMRDLGPAPSLSSLQLASVGEPIAAGKLLMLYIQASDDQAGLAMSFKQLNYEHLTSWLTRVLQLDPRANYPLFMAGRVYGAVSNLEKRRSMFEFIYQQFLLDPNRRWRALADAAVSARHSLKDLTLARKYTRALRLYATDRSVPVWARQMDIFMMEDMGEVKSARMLLGAMFSSGEITDPREIAFVLKRMTQLEAEEKPRQ